MQVGIRIEKDEITPFLNGIAKELPSEISNVMNLLAMDTTSKLGSLAPRGRSGKLSSQFKVDAYHNPEARVITPTARNLGGNFYASAVETGATGYSTLPNLSSIADYYSLPLFIEGNKFNPVVIAIAKKIKDGATAGARPRPFVQRTVDWLNTTRIPQRFSEFMNRIVAKKY